MLTISFPRPSGFPAAPVACSCFECPLSFFCVNIKKLPLRKRCPENRGLKISLYKDCVQIKSLEITESIDCIMDQLCRAGGQDVTHAEQLLHNTLILR